MLITNVSQAKAQLSALLERVRKGEEVVLGKAGRPIAKLVPYHLDHQPRQAGALHGKVRISEDFDELPSDIAIAFGMKD